MGLLTALPQAQTALLPHRRVPVPEQRQGEVPAAHSHPADRMVPAGPAAPAGAPPIHFRQLPFLLFRNQTDSQNTALPATSEPQKESEQRQKQAEEQKTLLSEEALYKQ